MMWRRMAAVAIVWLVLLAWAFILFKPSRRPDLMNSLAGCFHGDGRLAGVEMVISPEGMLNTQGQTLMVTVAQDKIGISFLPNRRIIYDPAFPSKLVIDSSDPLLMRINANHRSITIPGETQDIVFQKAACSGTKQPVT